MPPTSTEQPGTANSPTVVGVNLSATLKGAIYKFDVTPGVRSPGLVKFSVLPAAQANLNGSVSVVVASDLRAKSESANEDKNTALVQRAKPTADYLRKKSTGMKSDRKMIIKVDPPARNESISKPVPGLIFDKFSLQSVTENDEERYQLHETFSEEVLFVFGRRPRIWSLAGIVVNSDDANFADELISNYDAYYRGTRVVENRMRTFVFYEDVLIEGTLLGLTVSRNGQIPGAVNASITIVVHERGLIGKNSGDVQDENLAEFLSRAKASLGGEKIEPDQIRKQKPTSSRVSSAAASTAAVEALSNAVVAELEQQLTAARAAASETADAIDASRQFTEDAERELAAAEAAGDEDRAAMAREEIAASEAGKNALISEYQQQQSAISSLESQVAAEKKKMADAAAKGDTQNATAKGAEQAEAEKETGGGSASSDVTVDGKAYFVDQLFVVDVSVQAGTASAVTSNGGKTSYNLSFMSAELLASHMLSKYGVVIDQSQLTSSGYAKFIGKTTGRVL